MDTGALCEPIALDPAPSVRVERVLRPATSSAPEPFPHFHEPAELIWFARAEGSVATEWGMLPISDGTLLFLPAMTTHDFRLDPGATEWVLVHCDASLGYENLSAAQAIRPGAAVAARLAAGFDWLVALAEAPGRAGDVVMLTRLLLNELPGTAPQAETTAAERSLHRLRPALDLVVQADFRLVTVEEAAARCHLSPTYFSRAFARAFGVGFAEYARQFRLRAAARSLMTEGARVSDIAWRSGFQTPSHFTAAFRKRFGVSPSDFRRRYLAGR